jgi:hypothetical protein
MRERYKSFYISEIKRNFIRRFGCAQSMALASPRREDRFGQIQT